MIMAATTIPAKVKGRNDFQTRCISWSYLNLGNDVLSQMKKTIIKQAFELREMSGPKIPTHPPKKTVENRNPVNIMCAYSARKNKANVIPGYSTLKPDTSSLSPSVKSNGALFVSATQQTRYMNPTSIKGKRRTPWYFWTLTQSKKFSEDVDSTKDISIRPRATS